MFGGTPSNLAIALLRPGKVEVVSGMNLPMVLKALSLANDGKEPAEIARLLVGKARRSIVAATELIGPDGRAPR